jgi:hypothetical protein
MAQTLRQQALEWLRGRNQPQLWVGRSVGGSVIAPDSGQLDPLSSMAAAQAAGRSGNVAEPGSGMKAALTSPVTHPTHTGHVRPTLLAGIGCHED